MSKKHHEDFDNPSLSIPPFPEVPSITDIDPAAQAAVESHLKDFFNFELEEPREVQPSERDIATSVVFDHAQQLCAEYVEGADRKTKRQWNKERKITLPPTEIDGKEFQMATAVDPNTGATTITMSRVNVPDSGFTLLQKGETANLILDATDRPYALDDDQRYDDALKKATDWIDRYAQAVGITPEPWIPKSEISDEAVRRIVQSSLDRQAERALRRRKMKKPIGAILTVVGLTAVGFAGTEVLLDHHRESNAEFDATHFLPDGAPTIHIGETKPVGDGTELSQEVIDTADFTNGGTRAKVIENAGPHFIRANQDMEIAPKGHGTLLSGDCEHIKLEGLGPRGTIKVVALNKDTASSLEAHLDREEMRICNTRTDENASVKLSPRQLFIEITNPQS